MTIVTSHVFVKDIKQRRQKKRKPRSSYPIMKDLGVQNWCRRNVELEKKTSKCIQTIWDLKKNTGSSNLTFWILCFHPLFFNIKCRKIPKPQGFKPHKNRKAVLVVITFTLQLGPRRNIFAKVWIHVHLSGKNIIKLYKLVSLYELDLHKLIQQWLISSSDILKVRCFRNLSSTSSCSCCRFVPGKAHTGRDPGTCEGFPRCIPSLKLTSKAPENGCLDLESIVSFWGQVTVSFRECVYIYV